MPTKRATLVHKLDAVFSRFVRMRVADESGHANCFTCGVNRHWREVDAGHFITRAKYATRWDEVNVQFQCKRCNMNGGRQFEFGRNLNAKYGEGTADEIYLKSNRPARYTIEELTQMIAHYTAEVREFEKILG